ncbi:unnamed protein product [Lymnaea stagnalis]|uniref:Uncharacterized protein n=1 Tax=Lymnaea stagnalis TaxID=6523 RepID=A0AAV2H4F8_LYMST
MKITEIVFITLATALSLTMGQFDTDFCSQHMAGTANDPNPPPDRPRFFDNFFVMSEIKLMGVQVVENVEEFYSQQAQMVYVNINSPLTPEQIWVNANFDEVSVVPSDGEVCTDILLEKSVFFSMFHAYPVEGHFSLGTPAVVFGWDKSVIKNVAYQGEDISRGILTNKWWTCEYFEFNDISTFTEWQIVDPSKFRLPVVANNDSQVPPVLPISAIITYLNKTNPRNRTESTVRADFNHFQRIQSTDRHFQLTPNMICANSPSAQVPLPKMPNYFRFKGEQVLIENPSPPSLTYTIEQYNHDQGIFIQDLVNAADQGMASDKSYTRVVTDFNSGLTFTVNLNTGTCDVNKIDAGNVGAFSLASGFVQMRDANQFFDLDSDNYTYMGINRVEGRGIDCDVWSAYFTGFSPDHAPDTLYTWYFANSNWMTSQGYENTFPMPVMLELTSSTRLIQFHFYEYSTDQSIGLTDISACYTPDSTMNIKMYITGRFDQLFTPFPPGLRNGFIAALTGYTSLKSPLRISSLDFQPAPNDETMVQFKLLDKPTLPGNVEIALKQTQNSQIFSELSNKVKSGTFSIDIANSEAQGPGKRTVYVRSNSVQIMSGSTRIPPTSSTSTSYSAGSMAGIGIGLLVAGVLFGVLGIFLFKRFRGGGGSSGIGMEKMGNESNS